MPILMENKERYFHKLKSILKILKKLYSLVVIDTINSPYPGYEGYIQNIEHDIVYISRKIDEKAYAIIPISSIIDIYANNVDVDAKQVGKIKEKIDHVLMKDKKEQHKDKEAFMEKQEIEYQLYKILSNLKKEKDDTLLLKIYTKSIVYQVYDEINLSQISTITPDFLFVYYIEQNHEINNEVLIILPLKSIDSIIMYNDSAMPVIMHTPKEKSIHLVYEDSKENLILAKQNSNNTDENCVD